MTSKYSFWKYFHFLLPRISQQKQPVTFTQRKQIEPPSFFNDITDLNNYTDRGNPDFRPSCILWHKVLHNVCTTLVFDEVLNHIPEGRGELYLTTFERVYPVENYINLGSMEMISSGIRYHGSFQHNDYDVMVLDIDNRHTKKKLQVPDDGMSGFEWYPLEEPVRYHMVDARTLGGKVLLNFAVCGEFDLCIFFHRQGTRELLPVFMKSYCCK